ncbi:hypothetical protein [Methylopila capsulata]|uniref:hypothetical protein n=1 Tax=Methylopila capsulata TaxID=61654 RepID=UPI00195EBEEC|nr:hypothetical protein [Methylopila capsulata]
MADALERRAAERGVSLDVHVVDLASLEVVELDPADLADLDARSAEWRRTGEGAPLEEVVEWMRSWGGTAELPAPRVRRLWKRSFLRARS